MKRIDLNKEKYKMYNLWRIGVLGCGMELAHLFKEVIRWRSEIKKLVTFREGSHLVDFQVSKIIRENLKERGVVNSLGPNTQKADAGGSLKLRSA